MNVPTILWLKGCAMARGDDRCYVASAGVATVAAGLLRRFEGSHCELGATSHVYCVMLRDLFQLNELNDDVERCNF